MAAHDANLASHYSNPWLRQLPHYRTWSPAIVRSCNPFGDPTSLRRRRIAFLCIIFLRILESLFFAFVLYMRRPGLFLSTVWIVSIFFAFLLVAWNLHLIVEAEGERKMLRVAVPSQAFTAFLWMMVAIHVFLIGLEITGLSWLMDGTRKIWAFWILVICVVAWVTGREEDEGGVTLA
jgi:hypothetical protein